LDLFGTDLVVRPSAEIGEAYALVMEAGHDDPDARAEARASALETVSGAEFDPAAQVALYSHPEAGLGFYVGYDRVVAALAGRAGAGNLEMLLQYLDDDSVPPWLIERLVADAGPTADDVLSAALDRPGFRWRADGASLLASRKPSYVDTPIRPNLAILPTLALELDRDVLVPAIRDFDR
jgi:hypothetical protein